MLAIIAATAAAQNQSYAATYSRSQAMDPGISAQLCQNDMMIVRLPGAVRSVGVTLPANVEPIFDGSRVILRGNVASGRTPVVILMADSDDLYRIHLTACPSRGSSTLLTIQDDTPNPPSAARVGGAAPVLSSSPLNAVGPAVAPPALVSTTVPAAAPAPIAAAPVMATAPAPAPVGAAPAPTLRIPAPTTVRMEMSRTSTGIVLTVTNGTARTLALRPEHLRVTAGGQPVAIPAEVVASLAPGLTAAIAIPIPAALNVADVTVQWDVQVPDLRAAFPLGAALR